MADTAASNDTLVRDFCAAWADGDLERIMGFFAPDAVYHNIPMDPAEGEDAIRTFIEGFMAMGSSIRFEITHQLATDSMVMNERIDTITMGDRTVALPVAGSFEITDGRITAWRDYFDMAMFSGS